MTCRSFERQTADWLGRRLSPERSGEMAAHRETCPACARTAAAEARLRRLWQDGTAALPLSDLWPRMATRLDAPAAAGATGRKALGGSGLRTWTRRPVWALALAVAALGAFRWGALPHAVAPARTPPPRRTLAPLEPMVRPAAAPHDPWTALSDVAQSNPLVDDPVGANMEDVWTYLKTENNK